VSALGKLLQLLGLVIVPMALIYYLSHQGSASEAKLMFGELTLLAFGAMVFLLGRSLERR